MYELRKIMGLDGSYKVTKVEDKEDGKSTAKFIYLECISKKCKCPSCGKYTKSVHDRLKLIMLRYVKAFEFVTYVVLVKRRFICHDCKYKFTDNNFLDYESFIAYFKQITLEMLSSWNAGVNTYDNFYHAFVLGLMVGLKDEYYITSNRESGYGRYDVVLKAKDKSYPSFIMKFKVVKNTFEEAIDGEKKQIIDKKYDAELIKERYTKIERMVFAFKDKDVEIEVF